jgi:DNA-binding SARP family transcriptional activator
MKEAGRKRELADLIEGVRNNVSGSGGLRAALLPIVEEIRWAISEAQSSVEWHQRALASAQKRADLLERHLASYGELGSVEDDREVRAPIVPVCQGSDLDGNDAPQNALLAIYCFGPFRVQRAGRTIEAWNGTRGQAILKYFVSQGRKPVSRDVLMDTFWPDADQESARRNLHQAIYSLRQALRLEPATLRLILLENCHYLLNSDVAIWIDAEAFEDHVRTGRTFDGAGDPGEAAIQYASAIELYQAEYLAEELAADWAIPRREALRRDFTDSAERLSKYLYERAQYSAAELICHRIIEFDRCNETAHRRLMECYMQESQRALAVRQYNACIQALRADLGVQPSPETRSLFARLVQDGKSDISLSEFLPLAPPLSKA